MQIRSFLLPVFIAVSGMALSAPAQAQSDAPTPAVAYDVYGDLYLAMDEGVDQDAMMETTLAALADAIIESDPEAGIYEAGQPGLKVLLINHLRPVMLQYSQRLQKEFKPRQLALFREILTEDEARALAAFYRTPESRRVMQGMSEAYSPDAMIDLATSDPEAEIGVEAIEADLERASLKGADALTPAEQRVFGLKALSTPGLTKLALAQPRLMVLRAEMENSPMTRKEEVLLQQAIVAAFDAYYEAGLEPALE